MNYSTFPTIKFNSLVEITLINQQKSVHIASLYRFVQQCCNIRKLAMINCGQTYMDFSGSALRSIAFLKNCDEIRYLNISSTPIQSLQMIENLSNLRVLNICFCPNLRDLTGLQFSTKLQEIYAKHSGVENIDAITRFQNI